MAKATKAANKNKFLLITSRLDTNYSRIASALSSDRMMKDEIPKRIHVHPDHSDSLKKFLNKSRVGDVFIMGSEFIIVKQ